MLLMAKLVIFCSVISQGKVVALDRWGGKWNDLSMTHRLAINYAKNYCNRTPIVKVIVENVVTCFWDTVYFLTYLLYTLEIYSFENYSSYIVSEK